jgi:osmoprotectant transport system ATP-binding protein
LMDEPFGALDPITREALQDEVKKLQRRLNKTIIFVTHDMDEALKMADLIILMKEGQVVQAASPETLLANPADDFVAEFIGKHRLQSGPELETVQNVMKTNPVTVTKDKGIAESISLMKKKGVDSLIVVDQAGKLEGVVSIENIRQHGKSGQNIGALVEKDVAVISIDSDAKTAFDNLINNKLGFIIAVDSNNTVRGIITKTSMVKALAEVVWKGNEND